MRQEDYWIDARVRVKRSSKSAYKDVIGLYGTVTRYNGDYSGGIGVVIDGRINSASSHGIFWFKKHELEIIEESEDNNMTGFNKVAIVNLLDDSSKKDNAFALFDSEWALMEQGETEVKPNTLVVVNPRGKNNRILGVVKQIFTTEEYTSNVTAQVVGVVNMVGYDARVAEQERLIEIAKKKLAIEKELKEEINKINTIELYEKMAKDHPENTRLSELVAALKELDK